MRIAHVITRLIVGGAQENTLFTAVGLLRRGHDVTLISGPTKGPEGSLVREAESSGVPLIEVPSLVRDIRPRQDIAAYRRLCTLFKDGKYDVVHTHSAKAGILGRIAARRTLPDAVVVHTVHGPSFYPRQPRLAHAAYRLAERWAARYADHIVYVGEEMRTRYQNAGIGAPDRCSVIYSGFDLAAYREAARRRGEMRRRLGYGDDEVVIGMIGRLFPLKGQEYLVEAFGIVAGKLPRARLLLVGDGVLRGALEARARARGLAGRVVFAGLVPPSEIPAYVAAMDILAHTSLREGLPKAVAQGYAAGRPAVAFDVDGAREVVRDGETGYLVPAQDVGLLADRLAALAENPALRGEMGRRGQRLVEERFAVERMVAQIESLYLRVTDLRRGRRRCTVRTR